MAEMTYQNFDLRIERTRDRYKAQALYSPAGEANVEFDLPFKEGEMDDFLKSPDPAKVKALGERLFEAVFDDEVRGRLHSSIDITTKQGTGLRIRLRLADDPALVNLPWEYLYRRANDHFFCLSTETPLVRYLELPEPIEPLAVQPPLRVLAVISDPHDAVPLDVEEEWKKLKSALGDLEQQGLVKLEKLEEATLDALQQTLQRGEYHVFHFIGHGGLDPTSQDGVLILENEDETSRPVYGRQLSALLRDHRPLRLAVLNACEGARTSLDDPFAGVAQTLVQQGIPAVIAMRQQITDEASITLADKFYRALANGKPVDAALTEARKAIFTQGNEVEWGIPVLYMRAPDGKLFEVEREAEPAGIAGWLEKRGIPGWIIWPAALVLVAVMAVLLGTLLPGGLAPSTPTPTTTPPAAPVEEPKPAEPTPVPLPPDEPVQVGIASFAGCPELSDDLPDEIALGEDDVVFTALDEIQDSDTARGQSGLDLVIWGDCGKDNRLMAHLEILTAHGPLEVIELESLTAETSAIDLDRAGRLTRTAINYLGGEHGEAATSLDTLQREADAESEQAELALLLGNSLLFDEQYEDALAAYDIALEYEPLQAQAYNNRGVTGINRAMDLLLLNSEYDVVLGTALDDLSKAIEVSDENVTALAYINRGTGRYLLPSEYLEQALVDYEQALEDCERGIDLSAEPLQSLGLVCRAGIRYAMLEATEACDQPSLIIAARDDLAMAQAQTPDLAVIFYWRSQLAILQARCATGADREQYLQEARADQQEFLRLVNTQAVQLAIDRVLIDTSLFLEALD